jgi:hypothetical protein
MSGRLLVLSLLLATPAQAAAPAREVFAIVVTSNRSSALGRPELRYADDDGAKYYELFSMLAPEENVALLTEFDRDSAQLYAPLVKLAEAPTLANVRARFAKVAEAVRRARSGLRRADFYFVFAGHGDVDHGKGFIDLADAALPADELERLLTSVHSDHTHVIIDSCNSFFVIAPRKPGGRRFATPADAADGMVRRLPSVGVFLSTSAEAEVYEWSELQSGIFSHAVRSGLTGAADADGDGEVSYDELAAFVTVAARKVKNPLFRPQVFARGPGGDNTTPLVELQRARAAVLTLPADSQMRVTVRDRDEVPVVDVHKAEGLMLRLRLPIRIAQGASVEERALDGAGRVVRRHQLPSDARETVTLADASPAPLSSRGPNDLLQALFTEPFDEDAVEEYVAEQAERPPALGVSTEYAERMRTLLREMYRHERSQKIIAGAVLGAAGASFAVPGVIELATKHDETSRITGGMLLGIGGAFGLGAALVVAIPDRPMRLARDFERGYANPSVNLAALVAHTEASILDLEHRAYVGRVANGVAGGLLASVGIGLSVFLGIEIDPLTSISGVIPTIGGAAILAQACFETPLERLIRQWREDPLVIRSVAQPSPISLYPIVGGSAHGGMAGLGGRF